MVSDVFQGAQAGYLVDRTWGCHLPPPSKTSSQMKAGGLGIHPTKDTNLGDLVVIYSIQLTCCSWLNFAQFFGGHGRSTQQAGRSTRQVKPCNIPSGTMVFDNPLIKALIPGDGGIGTLRFP